MYALVSRKNGFGYILGEFFTNSAGHPVHDRLSLGFKELEEMAIFVERSSTI
jgi:hypothetical protein